MVSKLKHSHIKHTPHNQRYGVEDPRASCSFLVCGEDRAKTKEGTKPEGEKTSFYLISQPFLLLLNSSMPQSLNMLHMSLATNKK